MISEKRVLSANISIYGKEAILHDVINRYPACFERVIDGELDYVTKRLGVEEFSVHALDLGCGTGYITAKLAKKRNILIDSVDLSAEMIEVLRTKLGGTSSVKTYVSDVVKFVEHKTEERKNYDLIVLSGLLHHLYDYKGFLEKTMGIIKPGGYIYVIFEPYRTKNMRKGYPFLILFQMLLRRFIYDREGIRQRIATQLRGTLGDQIGNGEDSDKLIAEFHQCCTKDFDYGTITQTLLDAGVIIEKEATYPFSLYSWNYRLFSRIKFFHDHFRIIARMNDRDGHS